MKTVLLTGFEPFGGRNRNPTEAIVRNLDGQVVAGHQVVGVVLPCVFGASLVELRRQLRLRSPAGVVCLGLAAGRSDLTPERVAINVDDARIPDNAGAQPIDRPVVRGGPTAYWSTLPIKAIVAALRQGGWPASVSQTAGTFVCNHVFYGLMHALRRRPGVWGGFVHVPQEQGQADEGEPCLPLDRMTTAITVVLQTAIRCRRDQRRVGGATH